MATQVRESTVSEDGCTVCLTASTIYTGQCGNATIREGCAVFARCEHISQGNKLESPRFQNVRSFATAHWWNGASHHFIGVLRRYSQTYEPVHVPSTSALNASALRHIVNSGILRIWLHCHEKLWVNLDSEATQNAELKCTQYTHTAWNRRLP